MRLSLEEELQSFAVGDLLVETGKNKQYHLKEWIPGYGVLKYYQRLGNTTDLPIKEAMYLSGIISFNITTIVLPTFYVLDRLILQ